MGATYPELIEKEKDVKMILEYETDAYARKRSNLAKKWKDLAKQYPEVEALSDIEMAGFALGYKELKEVLLHAFFQLSTILTHSFRILNTNSFIIK